MRACLLVHFILALWSCLQPHASSLFRGWGGWGSRGVERGRREGVGHWSLKSSRLTQAYWWCVCTVSDPTACMCTCFYVCLESRTCVSSLFGWLKPLVCPSGWMSAAGRAAFLSPSICIVGPGRSCCCSQLAKWLSPPEASTTHKARASYYFRAHSAALSCYYKYCLRAWRGWMWIFFWRYLWGKRVSVLKQRPAQKQHQFTDYHVHWAAVCTEAGI